MGYQAGEGGLREGRKQKNTVRLASPSSAHVAGDEVAVGKLQEETRETGVDGKGTGIKAEEGDCPPFCKG